MTSKNSKMIEDGDGDIAEIISGASTGQLITHPSGMAAGCFIFPCLHQAPP